MKNALTAALLLLLAGPLAAGEPLPGWHQEVAAARAEAAETGKLILVDLYADWCGWCHRLEREVFSNPEFMDYAKRFVKLRVNVEDGGEGSALQSRYGASSLPTTLVLTPKMVLVEAISGFAPRRAFMQRLNGALVTHQQQEQALESLLQSDDPDQLLSVARDLHERGDGARAGGVYRRLLKLGDLPPRQRTWLLYVLADAQRLDEDFDGAVATLSQARQRAAKAGDEEHLEACDLLRIQIAQDRGVCTATLDALQTFIENHPGSDHRRKAQRSLQELSRTECT